MPVLNRKRRGFCSAPAGRSRGQGANALAERRRAAVQQAARHGRAKTPRPRCHRGPPGKSARVLRSAQVRLTAGTRVACPPYCETRSSPHRASATASPHAIQWLRVRLATARCLTSSPRLHSRSSVALRARWQPVDATSNLAIRSPPTNPARPGTRARIEGGSSCLPLSPGQVCALSAARQARAWSARAPQSRSPRPARARAARAR
jgi:hypothetical protein